MTDDLSTPEWTKNQQKENDYDYTVGWSSNAVF